MKRLAILGLPILLFTSLISCGGSSSGSGVTYKKGDRIYQDRILFDTSDENASNASIYLGQNKGIESVKLGRNNIKFGYRNKILTLRAEDLKEAGPGEKSATVTFKGSGKATVEIFNATKFIRTAQDFQAIGESKLACEGYYVLANDIDCSSITNFEPIGQYYSEKDTRNFYFHGVLDGDGYAIKNVRCSYSDSPTGPSGGGYQSNYDVYSGAPKFTNPAHQAGDNIGIFQVIGSSGLVRNLTFDNCSVHGRTIVGVVAGNVMGHVENVLVKSNCSVKMDTHFYDDDCNCGGAFGIIAGSANVSNLISLTSNISILSVYEDYNYEDYAGKIGNGWDHTAEEGNTDPWWRFAGVTKFVPDTQTKITDSNNKESNGVYSVAGKCWGQIKDSVGAAFTVRPYEGTPYAASVTHTHQAINKPTSGDSDLGSVENCGILSDTELKSASSFSQYNFDGTYVWDFQDGSLPALRENINRFEIAK